LIPVATTVVIPACSVITIASIVAFVGLVLLSFSLDYLALTDGMTASMYGTRSIWIEVVPSGGVTLSTFLADIIATTTLAVRFAIVVVATAAGAFVHIA